MIIIKRVGAGDKTAGGVRRDATYIGFLVEEGYNFRSRYRRPRSRRRRRSFPRVVSGVGVVAIPMGSRVAVGVRPLLLPRGGARGQAALGRVPTGKFFAKETLQLPEAPSLAAGLGAGAARRRGDARDGGSSLVVEIGGVGGVSGAAHGGLHLAGLARA